MGQIAIPIYEVDTDTTLRVFEDYLGTYSEELSVFDQDGTFIGVNSVSGYNSDRYADDDPRLFQFAHFVAYPKANLTALPDYSDSGGRDIPSAFWYHRTVDEFCDSVVAGLDSY